MNEKIIVFFILANEENFLELVFLKWLFKVGDEMYLFMGLIEI